MDATKQDLIDLIRRGSSFAQSIRAARAGLPSRDLADPHLRAAEHEVEDALLCIAEAIQMLGERPMQPIEVEYHEDDALAEYVEETASAPDTVGDIRDMLGEP